MAGIIQLVSLAAAAAQEPRALTGHTDPVYAVAFTPDGQWIVTGSFDQTLRLWNAKTLKTVRTMTGHSGIVLAVAVSPDGKRIASGALDNTIKLWDLPADLSPDTAGAANQKGEQDKPAEIPVLQPAANLGGHGSQIYGLDFNADGKRLISASNDKTVRLWDMEGNKQLKTVSTQDGAVYSVAFNPDGKTVLTGGADKTVRLIDVDNNSEIRRFNGPEFAVYTVAFSPDGKTLAAGGVGLGGNRKVFLWSVDNPQPTKVFEGHHDDVYTVQFAPGNGARLLTAGYSGTIKVWDVSAGKPIFETQLPEVVYAACYSPDGKHVLAASGNNNAYLLDLPAE